MCTWFDEKFGCKKMNNFQISVKKILVLKNIIVSLHRLFEQN